MDNRTRPAHSALNGKVFRHDDVFWKTHFPPLGFRCRCRTRALTAKQIAQKGLKVLSGDGDMVEKIVGVGRDKTPMSVTGWKDAKGNIHFTDSGWSYNPGEGQKEQLEGLLFQRAAKQYSGCEGSSFALTGGCAGRRAVFASILKELQSGFNKADYDSFVKNVLEDVRYPVNKTLAGCVDLQVYDFLAGKGIEPTTPHIWIWKDRLQHSRHAKVKDEEKRAKHTVNIEEIYNIPDAIIYGQAFFDTNNATILYLFDSVVGGKENKAIIGVNYRKNGINEIVTIDRMASGSIIGLRQYEKTR